MEGGRLSSKLVNKFRTAKKVNVPKGLSFIKSPDWLRYKNIDDRCFQYAFKLT